MDKKDIAILLNLIANPQISNKEISEQLRMSEATVSRRIGGLKQNGILKATQLIINRSLIGLEIYSLVLVPAKPWAHNISILQLFFKYHPYTGFQNRIFGKENALFVQMNVPTGTSSFLEKLLEGLKKENLIVSDILYEHTHDELRYPVDINKYNPSSREFDIDYDKIKLIQDKQFAPLSITKSSPVDMLLDPINLQILRELFIDASRSLKDIGAEIGVSKQKISRRNIDMGIDDWDYDIRYDRERFGVFNDVLYILNHDIKQLSRLDRILSEGFPFQARVFPLDNVYMLIIQLPAVDVMKFSNILQSMFERTDLYLLSRNHSKIYPPWHGNLGKDGSWLADENRITHSFNQSWDNLLSVKDFVDSLRGYELEELEELFQQE